MASKIAVLDFQVIRGKPFDTSLLVCEDIGGEMT